MGSFARKANNKILVYSEKLYSAERIECFISVLSRSLHDSNTTSFETGISKKTERLYTLIIKLRKINFSLYFYLSKQKY